MSEQARLGGWLRKLLDLTLRNPLINLRPSRGLAFLRPDPMHLLESLLAKDETGVGLMAFPWSDLPSSSLDAWLAAGDFSHPPSHVVETTSPQEYLLRDEATSRGKRRRRIEQADAAWDCALQSITPDGFVLVDAVGEDLQDDLADLDRQQRLRQQEGGVHTLYLAMGLLRWREQVNSTPIESPLVLLPVELVRANAQMPFFLRLRDEAAVFNPSIVHKLRQDFGLEIDCPLPEEGLKPADLAKVWEEVLLRVGMMSQWSVVAEARLGLFSFHKQHLWNDLAERAAAILAHPVVSRIAGGVDDPGRNDPVVDWDRLDERFSPKDLLTPLPVDASQMRALTLVDQGHNLVIDGPPGTGKSQTITNLIAHALGKGKRVLFVSEKATALSVVHDRLEDLGLGPFCLDLHSAKAQKAEVAAQFQRTLDIRCQHDSRAWELQAARLHAQRRDLNAAMEALHAPQPNGYSLFQGIGVWTTLTPPAQSVHLSTAALMHATPQAYDTTRRAVLAWARTHATLSPPARRFEPLAGQPLPDEDQLFGTIEQALEGISVLSMVLRSLGFSAGSQELALARAWSQLLPLMQQPVPPAWREWLLADDHAAQAVDYHDAKKRLAHAWSASAKIFQVGVLDLDASWIKAWNDTRAGFGGWFGRRRLAKQLAPHTLTGRPPAREWVDALVLAHPQIMQARAAVKSLDPGVDKQLRRWIQSASDWQSLLQGCAWAQRVHEIADHSPWKSQLLAGCATPPQGLDTAMVEQTQLSLARMDQASAIWRGWFGSHAGLPETPNATIEQWRNAWMDWKSARPAWPAFRQNEQAAAALRNEGLGPLIEASIEHHWSTGETEQAYLAAYWSQWISKTQEGIADWGVLGRQREHAIAEFAAKDAQVEHQTRHEILARLCATWRHAESMAPPAELRVLHHELGKKRAHIPPRQLLAKLPSLWPAMKPCLLMSPLSAAQHLGPDTPLFDLVVFDEASQIPVADAIGVIARGKQVVIVGDPKQMPPSRLFDAGDMEDEDDLTERDLDSILDECLSHMNRVQLNWHYRSRHEDLIAFSNHRYYNGELITFPSPNDRASSIRVHEIAGVYERATRRVNRPEAEAVVEAVVRHYQQPGAQSLGVITFNQNQQRLINRLLDNRRVQDPALDAAISAAPEELFIKNLESVQGDERDVIFFSTTFAPDASGNFPLQFGPLGQLGGERRLNVAITRARHSLEIFTSFHPGQMDVSHTKHKGIRDLRDYLLFARGGEQALLSVSVPTLGVADSPFEMAVREGLEQRGWLLVPQVGCSGYRIDLAVSHPTKPGTYLAGIECDGATYHSFKVARDRDRMRQRVLERLGWTILRIWSTDWWQDADGEIARIDQRLHELLSQDQVLDT